VIERVAKVFATRAITYTNTSHGQCYRLNCLYIKNWERSRFSQSGSHKVHCQLCSVP